MHQLTCTHARHAFQCNADRRWTDVLWGFILGTLVLGTIGGYIYVRFWHPSLYWEARNQEYISDGE